MTVTSIFFLIFLACGLMVYYAAPGKIQWMVLLLLSMVYYVFAAAGYTFIYLAGSTLLAYLDQSVGSRAGQEQRAEEEVCDGSNWGGNCREYPYLVFPEREFLLDHRFDFDKYGVPRIPCTSGDSSGKCHRHGLLYRTGDRVYSGLLLGNMQGAEKSAEAAVICLLFPAAYGRTDQQIFPDAAVI